MTSRLAIAFLHSTLLQSYYSSGGHPRHSPCPGLWGSSGYYSIISPQATPARPGILHAGTSGAGTLTAWSQPVYHNITWRTPDNRWYPHPICKSSSIQYPCGRGLPGLEVIEWTDQSISVEEEHNIGYIQGGIRAVYSASAAQLTGITLNPE